MKNPGAVKLLGNLKVRNVIATGHSGSANQLRIYYNAIHPTAAVIDGFILHGSGAAQLRTDLRTPAWKLLSEYEVSRANFSRQPDSDYLRTWEVAGAAHAGWDLIRILQTFYQRDLNQRVTGATCDRPPWSRVPAFQVQDAVYDGMKLWIEKGMPPPHAPPITFNSSGTIARDENGNALGGIRLAEIAVPTAANTGINAGGLRLATSSVRTFRSKPPKSPGFTQTTQPTSPLSSASRRRISTPATSPEMQPSKPSVTPKLPEWGSRTKVHARVRYIIFRIPDGALQVSSLGILPLH